MGEAPPSRRAVLAAGAALAAGTLAGCTGTDGTPPPPDPDLVLRNRVADEIGDLVRAYAATGTAFPGVSARLSPLAAEHDAHVAALRGPAGSPRLPSPTTTASSPAPAEAPPVPATAAAAVAWLAGLERSAARRRRRQSLRAGPDLARLLASVAACERVHAAVLGSDG